MTKKACKITKVSLRRDDLLMFFLFSETYECQGANCPSFEAQGASAISMSVLLAVAMATVAKFLA